MTGVRVVEGKVEALVEMCPGYTADGLEMGPNSIWNLFEPLPSWSFESTDSTVVDIGSVSEVVEILGDHVLWVDPSASEGTGGLVRFTADDILALEPGEILISPRPGRDPVSASRFTNFVNQLCS